MGIGMNFICSCCGYDSGILMLNQGTQESIQEVVQKYIHMYTQEIDWRMDRSREQQYRRILHELYRSAQTETIYNYDGCVCYGCKTTYEMLDILQRKEEEVFVGEQGRARSKPDPIRRMFHFSQEEWSSLLGDDLLCVFCSQEVERITEEKLMQGMSCPKCQAGKLAPGEEFELWD